VESDRVNYTFGLKINLGNYESCSINMSYSTDLKEGETPKDGMDRAVEFIENSIDKKRMELKGES